MTDEVDLRPDKSDGVPGRTIAPRRRLDAGLPSPSGDILTVVWPPVTIMIVEDSSIVRERLVSLVSELRHVAIVGEAADGFQAQALFRKHKPDAVILDIGLPGIDGIELLAQFKSEHPSCVVAMMTNFAAKEFRQRCLALGADHFFDKSTEFERVIDVLNAIPSQAEAPIGD